MNDAIVAARTALRARFETLLAKATDDGLPAGLDPSLMDEDAPTFDLAALCGALTDLSGQVRLQAKTFKQLQDSVAPLHDRLDAVAQSSSLHAAAVATFDARLEQAGRDGERKGAAVVLDALLDARERVRRALATAAAVRATPQRTSWWRRWLAAPDFSAVESLEEGVRLAMSRLDAALVELDVAEVAVAGAPFDPACMQAVDVVADSGARPETVIEVLRAGYSWRGSLLRTAQVKVAK